MHSDHPETRHHKNKHVAERFEGLLQKIMVVVVAVLAIGMGWAIFHNDPVPPWMR